MNNNNPNRTTYYTRRPGEMQSFLPEPEDNFTDAMSYKKIRKLGNSYYIVEVQFNHGKIFVRANHTEKTETIFVEVPPDKCKVYLFVNYSPRINESIQLEIGVTY